MENEAIRMAVEKLVHELDELKGQRFLEDMPKKREEGQLVDWQERFQPMIDAYEALAALKPLLADSPAEKCGECGGKKYIYVQANQGPGSGLSVRTLCHRCKGSGLEGE